MGAAPSCGKLEGWLSGVAVLTLMLSPVAVVELLLLLELEFVVEEEEEGNAADERGEIAGLVSALLPGLWKCT